MSEFIKRSLAGGVVLSGLVISILLTGATGVASAEVSTVQSASPGSIVSVSGTVELAGLLREVDLCWNTAGCDDLGSVQLGLLQTSYRTSVTIPANATPGDNVIYACVSPNNCDSTTIEIVLPPSPTTTTTTTTAPTTTTTVAATNTTTVAAATSTGATSTTLPAETSTTTADETPEGGIAASTPTTVGAVEHVAIQVSAPNPESPEDDIQGAPNPPSTPSTVYVPPTTTSMQAVPETSEPEANGDVEVVVVNAAADPGGLGWSFDSPVVFWAAWLLVVVILSGLVSGVWWLAGRRSRAE